MSWRVIAVGDQVWHVDALAERPANTYAWHRVLSFRTAAVRPRAPEAGGAGGARRSIWGPFPLEATSKASLFLPGERIPDAALSELLGRGVGGARSTCSTCGASWGRGAGVGARGTA